MTEEALTPWQAFVAQLEKSASEPEVRLRPKDLKQYASFDHETYAKQYGKDPSKMKCVAELAVKGADKFWPKEKLVPIGKGRLAPRPFESNAERREYRHRLASERGWTFTEVSGT